jgi:hypothetical protein
MPLHLALANSAHKHRSLLVLKPRRFSLYDTPKDSAAMNHRHRTQCICYVLPYDDEVAHHPLVLGRDGLAILHYKTLSFVGTFIFHRLVQLFSSHIRFVEAARSSSHAVLVSLCFEGKNK